MKAFIIIIILYVTWLISTSMCESGVGNGRSQCYADIVSLVTIPMVLGFVIGCLTGLSNTLQELAALLAPIIGWLALSNFLVIYELFQGKGVVQAVASVCLLGPPLFLFALPAAASCLSGQMLTTWLRDNL
jgi:ACR3 family arsenite efflux pump ArsB